MTIIRTITICTLISLALAAVAQAWGPDNVQPEVYLQSLTAAGERDARALPGFAGASAAEQQRLLEQGVRSRIVAAFFAGKDNMQREVDRTISRMVDQGLAKTSDVLVTLAQKERIRELFMEEMYKFMLDKPGTELENAYDSVKGTTTRVEFLMSQSLVWNKILESEIEDIITAINRRMGGEMDAPGIVNCKKQIWYQFDTLK